MSQVKMSEADYIQEQVDLIDVASTYLSLKKVGKNYFACCPFHSEKTPSFSIDPQNQLYHCFGCHAAGNVFHLVMHMEGCTFPEALRLLRERYDINTKGKKFYRGPVRRKVIEQPREKLPDKELDIISRELQSVLTLTPQHERHLLTSRGMTMDEIKVRGYRSFPDKPWTPFYNMTKRDYKGFPGMFTRRGKDGESYWSLPSMGEGILIPFHNEYNQIVGWQIRLDSPTPSTYCDTDFPEHFMIHEPENDDRTLVMWDGEVIAELHLAIGESKTIRTPKGVKLGEVGKKPGQKYFWLSSQGKENGVGASNPQPIHIAVPIATRQKWPVGKLLQTRKAWLTEGPFKADIGAEKLNTVFVGVAGLSSWRVMLDILIKMGVVEIVLAFDMDIARKKELSEQIKMLKDELTNNKIRKLSIALWQEEKHGKGIDDILIKNFKPKVIPFFDKY